MANRFTNGRPKSRDPNSPNVNQLFYSSAAEPILKKHSGYVYWQHVLVSNSAACRLTGRRVGRCGRQVRQSAAVVGLAASAGRVMSAATTRQRRRGSGGLDVRRIHVVRTNVLVPRTVHRLYRQPDRATNSPLFTA